tara:strand:- start:747 stop:998 length:252 start_codon:yes stop_codon:yes gene_type:complete
MSMKAKEVQGATFRIRRRKDPTISPRQFVDSSFHGVLIREHKEKASKWGHHFLVCHLKKMQEQKANEGDSETSDKEWTIRGGE